MKGVAVTTYARKSVHISLLEGVYALGKFPHFGNPITQVIYYSTRK